MRALIIALILSSCSASFHAKRAIKKNPNAFKADTTVVVDTLVIEVPKVDTSFVYQFDTVEMVINEVKIRHHYDTTTNEVYIEADCPDQEVITKTETITLPPIIIKPSWKDKIVSGLIIAAILIGLAILIHIVLK